MQQDNATQTGADSLQPAHAGRNAALAQIAKAVDQSYQEDLAQFDETAGTILPKQGATQEPQAAAQEQEGEQQEEQGEQEQQQPAQAQAQPQDELETIVVDGQQVQVKRSQLFDAGRRTLQKEATADKRLQEATETLRQVQAYAAQLRQNQPSSDAGGEQIQSPSSDATNRSGAQTQATQEDIRALVRHEQWLANAETAAQRFRTEFKDIADDPLLMRLAGQLEDERLALAASTGSLLGDPWEAYKKHGETIRERFGKPQTVKPAASEDRLERKRSTTTVVGAGARMQSAQPQKPLTTSEIIEQQRLARTRGRQIQTTR